MSSEESPLLAPVYDRFSRFQKRTILAMVVWCGLIPHFVSWSFIPSISQISKDLNSTHLFLGVSLSIFASSLGGLWGASYSTFYGRRVVYLSGLPLLCLGSAGVACFLQSFGASPGSQLGLLEERGGAIGMFFGVSVLLGPTLAPPVGGAVARYASWRVMQLALAISGALIFVTMFLFFPETSHPGKRGIDQVQPVSTPTLWRSWKPFLVNPLRPLSLLRSPNILAVVFLLPPVTVLTLAALLVPLAFTFGARYHITNDALIGAFGAPLAGRISDKIVVNWYPEDRLKAAVAGVAFLVPFSILFSGLLSHLILNLICLFINGVGVDIVLSTCAAYIVDIMHSRSAEVMAAYNALRSLLLSLSMALILPLINMIGVAATNALAAVLAWLALGILLCTIRYGTQMRAWVDVGYSTAENN
ncbi:major facilitator superfamily domain-containing protein [Infundibulicybe gibba]|nr:major facilitator superfamily domain-containing protein [Infundibulicybe gibba]